MTSYEFGSVVLVRFPFTHLAGSKKRPAVVISSAHYNQSRPDLILMAITSQVEKKSEEEALIHHWDSAGLLKPSVLKPILFTAEKSLIDNIIGKFSKTDQNVTKKLLSRIIG